MCMYVDGCVHVCMFCVYRGRKEMFYLTIHSTHFILRLYGIRHMVKNHSDEQEMQCKW